jgi:hypothetical protein
MTTEKTKKNEKKYSCEICDFVSCKKTDYNRHILTQKHINNENVVKNNALETDLTKYSCENCCKSFKDRAGIWRHNKKCIKEEKSVQKLEELEEVKPLCTNDNNELINYLLKENQEFKNLILEIVKKDTTTNNNIITNTNSHNKAFNLNFFLNETCKNAMNIMDFVESIQFQLSDLERVGEVGYIEGISNIIVKNLKALDITQRPVHCTDKKRETLYVKDDNKWEKDDENTKMHKMIRKVQDKNFRMIKKFKEKYPDYHKPSSKQSDVYNNIIIESMGGRGDNDYEKEEKIIKKVSKEVLVEK